MISIVIPLFNKEKHIANTLETVFKQTFQDFEIVIVNDGSTDNSLSVVSQFEDSRIRIINQTNAGVSAARNRGIKEAYGEWIAFLDADDEWYSDYLATQHDMSIKFPDADVLATNYYFKNSVGTVKETELHNIQTKEDYFILDNYFEVASHSSPPLWTSAIVVRKKAIESIGGFPEGIKSGEDLITWARLACKYKIAYCSLPLAIFKESASDSNVSKAKQRSGGEQYVLDELLKLYHSNPSKALKDYIFRWYKIYCVLLIEYEENHKINWIAFQAISFGGSIATFGMLSIFSLMPSRFARWLFLKLRR